MKKRLIEHNIPLAEISEESAREKNIRHGHPSTLHIWWARRPLAASRATAFAALIDDPGPDEPAPEDSGFETQREYLQDLIKRITPWEAVKDGNSEAIEEARQLIAEQYGQPPKVLDPFAGGGSIPLEALRLGCETYASDYNPVAVFIEKATLEWPQKFGIEVELPKEFVHGSTRMDADKEKSVSQSTLWDEGETEKVNLLAYLVEKWANIILEEAREEIGQFYPHESADGLIGAREIEHQDGWIPVGYLWARTIPCQNPSCGAEIPLIKQFWLAKKKNKKIAYRPVVDYLNKQVDFEILENAAAIEAANFDPSEGTVSRANARCLVCEQVTKAKQTRQLARNGKMDELMIAVVFHHPDQFGKRYRLATEEDVRVFNEAAVYLEEKLANWPHLETPIPNELAPPEGHRSCSNAVYGFTTWDKFFNSRQKLSLVTLLDNIIGGYERIINDINRLLEMTELSDIDSKNVTLAVMSYLALTLSRTSEFTSTFTRWYPGAEAPRNIFSRQSIAMLWDFEENNPFSDIAGSWKAMFERMLYGSKASFNSEWGQYGIVNNGTATDLPYPKEYFDAVLTWTLSIWDLSR